jgi:hypothetical protein
MVGKVCFLPAGFFAPVYVLLALPLLASFPIAARGQTPNPPTLGIQSAGPQAEVSWDGPGFWLQAAEDLNEPEPWYNSIWPALNSGGHNSAFVPVDAPMRFFRLVFSTTLPPPTGLRVQAGDGILLVTWDAVSNAVAYSVYLATSAGIGQATYTILPGGQRFTGLTDTTLYLDNLTPGLRYFAVATAVDAGSNESADSNPDSDIFGPHGRVSGSFYTEIVDATGTNRYVVPGVSAFLSDTNTGSAAQETTDGNGTFLAASLAAGIYQLSWHAAGYLSGTNAQLIAVSNGIVTLPPQKLEPLPGLGSVHGLVSLLDGSLPSFFDQMFGIDVKATVSVSRSGKILLSTSPNALGEYVLAGLPLDTNLVLVANFEAARVETNLDTFTVSAADLVLPNSRPAISSVTALVAGQTVPFAAPGTTVQVQAAASDPEAQPLHYRWLADVGAEGLVPADTGTVALVLPTNSGPVRIFVLVNDGYGGYRVGRFDFTAQDQLDFSGYVCGASNSFVAGAQVNVNSHGTLSDSSGFFALSVPASEGSFTLAIQAPGYAPLVRVFSNSVVGQIYCLAPSPTVCTAWSGEPVTFSDSYGAAITLQSNSLVYAPGVPYTGPICVQIATYDPCVGQPDFPAGYSVSNGPGQGALLLPQAAVRFAISDPVGTPLALAPGLPALVRLPLGLTCVADPNTPSSVPAWELDPTNNVWLLAGSATREQDISGAISFTAPLFQLGVLAVGAAPQQTTVELDPDRTLNLPFEVRLSTQPKTVLIELDIRSRSFVVPQNQEVTIDILSPKEAPGEFLSNPNDPATVRAVKDKTVILRLKKTFTEAAVKLPVSLQQAIPNLNAPGVADNEHFLTYHSTGTEQGGNQGVGNSYYGAIAGWAVNRNTFTDWLKRNSFLPPNGSYPGNYTEDASAYYFNATDLGFGRSMHMKTRNGADGKTDIAYWVVNYRTLEGGLADGADKPTPGLDGKLMVATVAMDFAYDAKTRKRFTKFFVFDPGPFGSLRDEADLDGGENKLVPNLCVTCHGTSPVSVRRLPRKAGVPEQFAMTPPDGDVGGRFIPFDLEGFTYAKSNAVAKAQFRALNRGIYLNTPMTAAMKALIEGWYGGPLNNANNNDFSVNMVPPDWNVQAALYRDAVRVSCRGCHTMREGPIAFGSFNDFSNKIDEDIVCRQLLMPNAQRTFSVFWGSMSANIITPGSVPNQPDKLAKQFKWAACPAKP